MLAISWSAFLNVVYHDIWLCYVSVPVLVAKFSTSISWHTKCIRNIWYVFPKFSEVICLPFLTPGVQHMACYLEFPIFQRFLEFACPIESTDFVISLTLNDFLNIAKSHLNTFNSLISSNDARILTYVNLESYFSSQRKLQILNQLLWNWYFLDSDLPIKFLIKTFQMFFHLW